MCIRDRDEVGDIDQNIDLSGNQHVGTDNRHRDDSELHQHTSQCGGNVFSGQVVGETAKTLSERFGKVLQQRQSMTINRNDKSTSISTQMDSLIPASKISNLTQGMFVGAVSDLSLIHI